MKDAEVLRLLQYEHHNYMNDLQVIQGYINMQKSDKALQKINECAASFRKRKKLINTKTPMFTMWMIQFNMLQENIRLTYQVNTKKSLQIIDEKLVKDCRHVIDRILNYGDTRELYEVTIDLADGISSVIILTLTVTGNSSDLAELFKYMSKNKQANFSIKDKTKSIFTCEFTYVL